MEQVDGQNRSSTSPPHDYGVDGSEERGRIDKITHEMRGLVGDVKEWAELKLQLFQLQLEERIEGFASKIMAVVAMAVTGLIALVFLLTAAALGLGSWLGHPAWGYLTVGGFLLIVTIILQARRPRLRGNGEEAEKKALRGNGEEADKKVLQAPAETLASPAQQPLQQLKQKSDGP